MLFLGRLLAGGPVVEFFDSGGGLFTAIMLLMLIGSPMNSPQNYGVFKADRLLRG